LQVTAVQEKLQGLTKDYLALLTEQDAQGRGFKLEKILRELFELFDLDPKASFRIVGEQIDGAFTFERPTIFWRQSGSRRPSVLLTLMSWQVDYLANLITHSDCFSLSMASPPKAFRHIHPEGG
jgi:hypothetical protein